VNPVIEREAKLDKLEMERGRISSTIKNTKYIVEKGRYQICNDQKP